VGAGVAGRGLVGKGVVRAPQKGLREGEIGALAAAGETTMTLPWIAKGLKMGTAVSLANLLRDAKGK